MKTYQYQVLRYLPDKVSGEFINLGVVVYDKKNSSLKGRFYKKTNRLHAIFPTLNARFIIQSIKWIDAGITKLAEDIAKPILFEGVDSIEELTQQVLPKDDSALHFTEMKKVVDAELEYVLQYLFERIVHKHIHESEQEHLHDDEVWRKVYKDFFDRYDLTKDLQPKKVMTKLDEWNFDKTVQNGVLHCFETVSFALSTEDYVKRKVYTWAGRIAELETAEDKLHLYLLTALPKNQNLKQFIKEKLGHIQTGNAVIDLVDAASADAILEKVKREIEEH